MVLTPLKNLVFGVSQVGAALDGLLKSQRRVLAETSFKNQWFRCPSERERSHLARDILQKPSWTPSKPEPEASFCMGPLQNLKNEHYVEGITFKVRCGRHTSDESLRRLTFLEFQLHWNVKTQISKCYFTCEFQNKNVHTLSCKFQSTLFLKISSLFSNIKCEVSNCKFKLQMWSFEAALAAS